MRAIRGALPGVLSLSSGSGNTWPFVLDTGEGYAFRMSPFLPDCCTQKEFGFRSTVGMNARWVPILVSIVPGTLGWLQSWNGGNTTHHNISSRGVAVAIRVGICFTNIHSFFGVVFLGQPFFL